MASTSNKTSNKLRIAVCVLYIAQVFFFSETYSYVFDATGKADPAGLSCFSLIYKSINVGEFGLAGYSIVMALIPIIGFFIFTFDKSRNIKNIYGVLSSVIAVFLILATIGGYIGFGATMALILYIPIVFLSVMGMFSKMMLK